MFKRTSSSRLVVLVGVFANAALLFALPHSKLALAAQTYTVYGECAVQVAPSRLRAGQTAVLTASCNPPATGYFWSGGVCEGLRTASCMVAPTRTTTYSVTGTSPGASGTASATVVVGSGDMTPIMSLMLDD